MSLLVLIFSSNLVRKSQYSEAQQTLFVHDPAQNLVLHFWEHHTLGFKANSGTSKCNTAHSPKPQSIHATFKGGYKVTGNSLDDLQSTKSNYMGLSYSRV